MSSSIPSGEDRPPHIPALDGWRGLAVALVLLGHFGVDRYVPRLSSFGVDLFFVLSGRLMADILFVRRMPLASFFARRFARVYPTLCVFVAVTGLVFWGSPLEYGLSLSTLALTFTLNYAIVYGYPYTLLDHIWSLCVEEHSYILLALIALAFRSAGRRGIAAILLAVGIAAAINGIIQFDVFHYGARVFWRTDVAMAEIFISGALFLLFEAKGHGRLWPWLVPVALPLAALAQFLGPNAAVFSGAKTILLAMAAVGIERAVLPMKAVLEARTLRFLGQCSFSVYLWQQPFYKLSLYGSVQPALLLFLAVACGIAGYYRIERPLRSGANAVFQRWTVARIGIAG